MRGRRDLTGVMLVPPAALLVHQLRYLLAFGSATGAELARQGHAYLHSVTPWIVLCLGLTAGLGLRALGRAFHGHVTPGRYGRSLLALWLACAVTLITLYMVQETLEGLFATGHPAGFSGIFGYGGWWAIPAAVCVALVLATVLHGALWVLRTIARRHRPVPRRRWAAPRLPRPALRVPASPAPLVAGWCDRGPPV